MQQEHEKKYQIDSVGLRIFPDIFENIAVGKPGRYGSHDNNATGEHVNKVHGTDPIGIVLGGEQGGSDLGESLIKQGAITSTTWRC